MIRKFLIFLIIVSSSAIWAQHSKLLPIADNGKWGLIHADGKSFLAPTYDYLDYSYIGQKFIYHSKSKVGVIDGKGAVFTEPIYDQVSFLDTSWYCYREGDNWSLMFEDELVLSQNYDSITRLNYEVFRLILNDSIQYFNNKTRKLSESYYIDGKVQDNFVLAYKTKGGFDLLNQSDLTVFQKDLKAYEKKTDDLRVLVSDVDSRILDTSKNQILFSNYEHIIYSNSKYFIGIKNGAYKFLDTESLKSFDIPQSAGISDVNYPFIVFENNSKVGLYNLKTSTIILAPAFDGINFSSNQVYVLKDGLYGLHSMNGQEIIPPSFTDITDYDRFYQVEYAGKKGLISRSGKEIEPSVYNEIRIYDSNIKCISANKLVLINMDQEGTIKDRKVYDEFMSLSFEKQVLPRQRSQNMNFSGPSSSKDAIVEDKDEIYNNYGWYRLIREVQRKDTIIKVKGKWSLHSFEDSVLINKRYKSLWLVDDNRYTFAFRGKILDVGLPKDKENAHKQSAFYGFHNNIGYSRGFFEWIDNRTRTKITKELYQHIFLKDFQKYDYARALTKKPILIDTAGNVLHNDLTYMGRQIEGFLLICQGGEVEKTKFKSNSIYDFNSYNYLSNLGLKSIGTHDAWPNFRINKGAWHFIKKNGEKLNETPFQFATDFVNGQAIVQQNGRWGVIDTALTVIVPIEYSQVSRKYSNGKLYYQVSHKVNKNYIYERSSGKFSESNIDQFSDYSNGMWFAHNSKSKNWAMVDTNLKNITPFQYQYVSTFNQHYAQVTRKGKKQIITDSGDIYFNGFKTRSITPLGYDRFEVFIKKKKKLILNLKGDTLIDYNNCQEILATTEKYIVYRDIANSIQIISDKEEIHLPKKASILSYNLQNDEVFVQKGSKNRLFSMKTGKYLSKHLENAISIGPNCYVFKNPSQKLGIISLEGDTLVHAEYEEILFQVDGWAIAKKDKNEFYLINAKGEKINQNLFTRFRDYDEYKFAYSKNGVGLLTKESKLIIPCEYDYISKYNEVYFKVTVNSTSYLLNKDGSKVINRPFKDIKAVNSNGLIVSHHGADFLYSGYINQALSFQSITPISSDKFLMKEKVKYGMYTTTGKLIIPVEYHYIKNDRELFKVRFFNSFGYFSNDGKSLFDPKN